MPPKECMTRDNPIGTRRVTMANNSETKQVLCMNHVNACARAQQYSGTAVQHTTHQSN